MSELQISNKVVEALQKFHLPKEIGFGKVISPIMVVADCEDGHWGSLRIIPYGPIGLYPTAKVFHYAQEIFEGLKAYNVSGNGPLLFRPIENAMRFDFSAKRMAMPTLPENYFFDAVKAITSYSAKFIPTQSGESLYIRPFMFATEENLGIKPSRNFRFIVIASPSGSYFASGAQGISVMIERNAVRAFPGGTGMAKTGGNYASSLNSANEATKLGHQQTLWLDATQGHYIEEMSGMNFCCILDGELVTPPLSDTILAGITRDTILKLAELEGIKVRQQKIPLEVLLNAITDGECSEAFACGTAAIVTPLAKICEKEGKEYPLKYPNGNISSKLREIILSIQEGRTKDPADWIVRVPPTEY